VARIERTDTRIGVWWENLKKEDHLNELGADGRIILKWYLDGME
jgi:hypothetical protein